MLASEPNEANGTLPSENLHFEIHPSVIFQLGESLISDEVQALVELVKNAYDADAKFARVTIDTKGNLAASAFSRYPDASGYIIIEDDGVGMDRQTIEEGWLTISDSPKRVMKRSAEAPRRESRSTKKGRTPLGDKGLGRLGSQRLGHHLEIWTRPEDDEANGTLPSDVEYYVALDWRDLFGQSDLTKVPVNYQEIRPAKRKEGTKIIISDLQNMDYWRGNSITRLQTALSKMMTPYEKRKGFRVKVKIDGKRLDLAQIEPEVRQTAQLHYRIEFKRVKSQTASENYLFHVKGQAKLAFLRPESKKEQELFKELVEVPADGGQRFLNFLLTLPQAKRFALSKSADSGWFVEYEHKRLLTDFEGLAYLNGKPASPGPFVAEIDSFDLEAESSLSIFDRASDYRQYIRDLSGIRIYRDGFEIRVDHDWLKLGQQRTSYGLSPANTSGYVALSAKDNAVLEETTDREGFKVTPYYDNFLEMLLDFVRFSNQAQRFLRLGWIKYASGALGLNEYGQNIQYDRRNQSPSSVLENKIEALRYQLSHTYQTVSLGLTAEARSHEIHQIASRLAYQTQVIVENVIERNMTDVRIWTFIEYVSSGVSGLRKQISHLTPSLKYVTKKREKIVIYEIFKYYTKFYRGRLSNRNIGVEIVSMDRDQLAICVNRGQMFQIIDNFLLNSEYWLRQDLKLGDIKHGVITIEISHPFVRISDNGRGIEPSVESSLFEPFVTTKRDGRGRGLGLFIVQQLLDSEGCSISLLGKRNQYGRRYIFEIDFTGALVTND